jgi:hypothetical protein
VHQETAHEPPLDTVATDGFRIYASVFDPSRPKRDPPSRIPAAGVRAPLFAWAPWEAPTRRMEPKAGTGRIRAAFHALPDRVGAPAAALGDRHAR